ncbi:hypothetical protein EVAR_70475_1 [Eumeta japonica]|uniref:Uncharacterized protein n=1 Tax=Eumeta variegata TaxID=151549 RepID=A0A4C2A8D3_EUMVA|nr:hypothetical protein EVAR_70475_1 [Eumeta japonica]
MYTEEILSLFQRSSFLGRVTRCARASGAAARRRGRCAPNDPHSRFNRPINIWSHVLKRQWTSSRALRWLAHRNGGPLSILMYVCYAAKHVRGGDASSPARALISLLGSRDRGR